MADIHRTNVVEIEPKVNENGTEFLLVTISKKDRNGAETRKQKKIYDFNMQAVLEQGGCGVYNFSYEKQPDLSYWLVGIAALDGLEPTKPVTKPVLKASTASKNDSGAAKSHYADSGSNKDRQIAAAVILKATVEFMAIHEAPITEAQVYFKALADVYETYIAEPAKIAAAAKEMEQEVPF